ncbi:type IA DNA topoisomerase [Campylobacter jejuni]|nr:type IA DNA topoisomerase [Campylobacter jejuni]EFS0701715.1 type IA DNA topoisomerase [Campylobacter jejuni]EHS1057275.1 type IA DNA topoisomerase [Campylobacter jejuni]EHS1059160.1 type IA DNA topoisomerase [Campylobacter jejuni]EHS1060911.1 type IA DNA topoisomerase [Campylobacter jejuni]
MQNTIIIIESPNKREKIEKITGAKVYATKGHFKTLSKNFLKEYEKYEPIFDFSDDETKKRMNAIFADCKGKDVIIATDPDREGYGIAYLFYEVIKNIAKSIKRAEFHEITESGINKGLKNAIEFSKSNLNDFEAFKARIVGDKMVGFIMSPKYINALNDKNISVGRVQTPALSLIVQREKAIQEFLNDDKNKKLDYKIKAKLEKDGIIFYANNSNLYQSKEEALEKIESLKAKNAKLYSIDIKQKEIKPAQPFRTSQFQEKASKIFGFSPDKSMALAQKLFEKGLITYHRTDSNALSEEFLNEVEDFFKEKQWYQKREYKAGEQSQAEAHEAIRISHLHNFEDIEKIAREESLSDDEKQAYILIYLNSIQSQAKNAINEITSYDFNIGLLSFKTNTSKCINKGFKGAFDFKEEDEKDEKDDAQELELNIKEGEEIQVLNFELIEVKKQAPRRYKESNFISLLEKEGIGRPSTYASFLKTLLDRKYVELALKGKNKEIVATKKGISLIDFLNENNDEWITKSEFTKQMEEILDTISKGSLQYIDFIKPLHQKMEFVIIDDSQQIRKPSDKQIAFAEKLAKDNNLDLPKDYKENIKVCMNFIDKAKENSKPLPASAKQIAFAEKLAKDNNLDLPKDYKENMKVCSSFIDEAMKKK